MGPRSASHMPKHAQMAGIRDQWGEFQTHTFHVVPSMGPIISVMN